MTQQEFDKISKNNVLKGKFKKAFLDIMEEVDEKLIGKVSTNYILSVFLNQGYWSGVRYNIHFNYDYGFEYEERRFG